MKKALTFSDVRDVIIGELSRYFDKAGIDSSSFEDEEDLFKSGIIDSLDFLELIEVLAEKHGLDFDLSKVMDPNISTMKILVNEGIRQNQ